MLLQAAFLYLTNFPMHAFKDNFALGPLHGKDSRAALSGRCVDTPLVKRERAFRHDAVPTMGSAGEGTTLPTNKPTNSL